MCWKVQNSKQNTVMFPQCPRDTGDILTWVNISDWFVTGCTPRDKQEWFLDVRGPLIVSIYNQTFVKQIVGNMAQCPTSTLELILARDLNHSICYKHRLLDWIVLSRYGQIQTLKTGSADKWFLDILHVYRAGVGTQVPWHWHTLEQDWETRGKSSWNSGLLSIMGSRYHPEYIRTKTVPKQIRLHLQVRKLQSR